MYLMWNGLEIKGLTESYVIQPRSVSRQFEYSKSSLLRSQLIRMLDNPDRNKTNEKCWSQLSTYMYFRRHIVFVKADNSLVC
jgi:hypothetical protein